MKRAIALTVLLTLFSSAVIAEDLPKSGKYTGRYDWNFDGKAYAVGPDRTILSGNLPGVIFNDVGKGFCTTRGSTAKSFGISTKANPTPTAVASPPTPMAIKQYRCGHA